VRGRARPRCAAQAPEGGTGLMAEAVSVDRQKQVMEEDG